MQGNATERTSGGKRLRAILYARISTSDKGQDPEMQLREMRQAAKQRGWQHTELTDQGISGSKDSRPALDRLWTMCRRGQVDAVMVYRFDRFARSTKQLLNALEEFRTLNIHFVSL